MPDSGTGNAGAEQDRVLPLLPERGRAIEMSTRVGSEEVPEHIEDADETKGAAPSRSLQQEDGSKHDPRFPLTVLSVPDGGATPAGVQSAGKLATIEPVSDARPLDAFDPRLGDEAGHRLKQSSSTGMETPVIDRKLFHVCEPVSAAQVRRAFATREELLDTSQGEDWVEKQVLRVPRVLDSIADEVEIQDHSDRSSPEAHGRFSSASARHAEPDYDLDALSDCDRVSSQNDFTESTPTTRGSPEDIVPEHATGEAPSSVSDLAEPEEDIEDFADDVAPLKENVIGRDTTTATPSNIVRCHSVEQSPVRRTPTPVSGANVQSGTSPWPRAAPGNPLPAMSSLFTNGHGAPLRKNLECDSHAKALFPANRQGSPRRGCAPAESSVRVAYGDAERQPQGGQRSKRRTPESGLGSDSEPPELAYGPTRIPDRTRPQVSSLFRTGAGNSIGLKASQNMQKRPRVGSIGSLGPPKGQSMSSLFSTGAGRPVAMVPRVEPLEHKSLFSHPPLDGRAPARASSNGNANRTPSEPLTLFKKASSAYSPATRPIETSTLARTSSLRRTAAACPSRERAAANRNLLHTRGSVGAGPISHGISTKQFKRPRKVTPKPIQRKPERNLRELPSWPIPAILRCIALQPIEPVLETSGEATQLRSGTSLWNLAFSRSALALALRCRFQTSVVQVCDAPVFRFLAQGAFRDATSIGPEAFEAWTAALFHRTDGPITCIGSPAWTRMVFALAVWKYAKLIHWRRKAKQHVYQQSGGQLTCGLVAREFVRRIRREWTDNWQSPLLRIIRGDDPPNTHIVLGVAGIEEEAAQKPLLLVVSDGWYVCRAVLDAALAYLIRSRGWLGVGDKIHVSHAKVVPVQAGHFVFGAGDELGSRALRLHVNGVRKVRPCYQQQAKMGRQRGMLFETSLRKVIPKGGPIPCLIVGLLRVYPVCFLEKVLNDEDEESNGSQSQDGTPDRRLVWRRQEDEELAAEEHLARHATMAEAGSLGGSPDIAPRHVCRFVDVKVGSAVEKGPRRRSDSAIARIWNPSDDMLAWLKKEVSCIMLFGSHSMRIGEISVEAGNVAPAPRLWQTSVSPPTSLRPLTTSSDLMRNHDLVGEDVDGAYVVVHVGSMSAGPTRHVFMVDQFTSIRVVALRLVGDDARNPPGALVPRGRGAPGQGVSGGRSKHQPRAIGIRDARVVGYDSSTEITNLRASIRTSFVSPSRRSANSSARLANEDISGRVNRLHAMLENATIRNQLECVRDAVIAITAGDASRISEWYSASGSDHENAQSE